MDEPRCVKCKSTNLGRYVENETNNPVTIKLLCLDCLTDFFDLRDSLTLKLPPLVGGGPGSEI
jgi:hypothetical protein